MPKEAKINAEQDEKTTDNAQQETPAEGSLPPETQDTTEEIAELMSAAEEIAPAPEGEGEGEEAESEGEGAGEGKAAGAKPGEAAGGPEEKAPTAPGAVQRVPWRGQQLTPEEIVQRLTEDPSELAAVAQTLEQFPHLQRVHAEMKRALEQRATETTPGEGGAAASAERQEAVKKALLQAGEASIETATSLGAEPEFFEFYPNMSRLIGGMFARHEATLAGLQAAVDHVLGSTSEVEADMLLKRADTVLASLADSGPEAFREHLSPLQDPEERKRFLLHLDEVSRQTYGVPLPTEILDNPELLAREYVAMIASPLAAELSEARRREKETREHARAAARGTAPAPAPAGTGRKKPPKEWDDLFE